MDKEKIVELIKAMYPEAEIEVSTIEVHKPEETEEEKIEKLIDMTVSNLMGYTGGEKVDLRSVQESAKAFTYVFMKIRGILNAFKEENDEQFGYEVLNEAIKRMIDVSNNDGEFDFEIVVMPKCECNECNKLN